MPDHKKKFWLENPFSLFSNMEKIVPLKSMCLSDQMNSLTRITIFIALILFLVKPTSSIIFLIVSLLFIIIVYYIQKRDMEKYIEGYTNLSKPNTHPSNKFFTNDKNVKYSRQDNGTVIDRRQALTWCNDEVTVAPNDPNYISINQALAGPPNPKTLIAPVVAPPIADLDSWRANNLVNHSHINTENQTDLYLSGYQVSNCCDRINVCMKPVDPLDGDVVENYSAGTVYEGITQADKPVANVCNPEKFKPIVSPVPSSMYPFLKGKVVDENCTDIKENFQYGQCEGRTPLGDNPAPKPIVSPVPSSMYPFLKGKVVDENCVEEYQHLNTRDAYHLSKDDIIRPNEPGWVNTMCGYNPDQLYEANLPTNLMVGNCDKTPQMKQINKNIFMQNIQPDIYQESEIIEPINSNIGISFTQQFQPTTCSDKDNKGLTFTEHDPRIYKPPEKPIELPNNITEANVYDPRFSGYGTSYRSYNDTNIGQTRFYYDDINAVRMPNYISRSNIDFAKYADKYGPLENNNRMGNQFNSQIRALAQNTFLESSLQQRTELQQRLMRKRNNELWQLRKKPIMTSGSYQTGMKRC